MRVWWSMTRHACISWTYGIIRSGWSQVLVTGGVATRDFNSGGTVVLNNKTMSSVVVSGH